MNWVCSFILNCYAYMSQFLLKMKKKMKSFKLIFTDFFESFHEKDCEKEIELLLTYFFKKLLVTLKNLHIINTN